MDGSAFRRGNQDAVRDDLAIRQSPLSRSVLRPIRLRKDIAGRLAGDVVFMYGQVVRGIEDPRTQQEVNSQAASCAACTRCVQVVRGLASNLRCTLQPTRPMLISASQRWPLVSWNASRCVPSSRLIRSQRHWATSRTGRSSSDFESASGRRTSLASVTHLCSKTFHGAPSLPPDCRLSRRQKGPVSRAFLFGAYGT